MGDAEHPLRLFARRLRRPFVRSERLGHALYVEVGRNAHVTSPPRVEEIRRLLDAGADVNYYGYYESVLSRAGRSPWCSAEIVALLLERGADPDGRQARGLVPPLVRAAHDSDEDRLRLLIDACRYPDACDHYGRTALHELCSWASPAVIARLLSRGVDPNAPTVHGARPLHLAALWGHAAAARLLLEYGAEPDAPDGHGNSALTLLHRHGCNGRPGVATPTSREEIASLLLAAGAAPPGGE